jgi:CHAD domain-containing protein
VIRDLHHWRRALERNVGLALAGDAPEAIHQVRVATRRLRCFLALQGRRALGGDLQALGRALGPARDLHLVGGIPPMRAWARARGVKARAEAAEVLRSPRTSGLLAALRSLPGQPGRHAGRELKQLERRARRALAQRDAADEGTFGERTHRLRQAVRRLRYARDALGLPVSELAAAQEELGAYCDLLAMRRLLALWAEDTGAEAGPALARLDAALRRPVPGYGHANQAHQPDGR